MIARLQKSMKDKDQGFTLIELLVVIVIIGILAAIAIPLFLSQREKGVDSSLKSDLKSLATTLETFNTDNPTSNTAYTATSAANFKKTTGNTLVVKGSPASGICAQAYSASGTADTATTVAFWYDSKLGGLQPGSPGAAPAGGACADATVTAFTAVTL